MLNDGIDICLNAINKCLPDVSLKQELAKLDIRGNIYLLAVGKAAYTMMKTACELLDYQEGFLISKYDHIKEEIKNVQAYEAGHPIVDENSIKATDKALEFLNKLDKDDTLIFMLSGGASALFEKPLIDLKQLQDLNEQMLRKGLSINEINIIRKKLSAVKGGKLVTYTNHARIISLILSDVLDDDLSAIGSGLTYSDLSTNKDALDIINKYDLKLSKQAMDIINNSKEMIVDDGEYHIIGSIKKLCEYALMEARKLNYETILIGDSVNKNIDEVIEDLKNNINKYLDTDKDLVLVMGSEISINVKGDGKGGRNQELVFRMMKEIAGLKNVYFISLASDGTDGPTDAAGGYVDGESYYRFIAAGYDYDDYLNRNDSYNGLEKIGALIKTGPSGTNVNDISLILIKHD